jgi:hypothetical protein
MTSGEASYGAFAKLLEANLITSDTLLELGVNGSEIANPGFAPCDAHPSFRK